MKQTGRGRVLFRAARRFVRKTCESSGGTALLGIAGILILLLVALCCHTAVGVVAYTWWGIDLFGVERALAEHDPERPATPPPEDQSKRRRRRDVSEWSRY